MTDTTKATGTKPAAQTKDTDPAPTPADPTSSKLGFGAGTGEDAELVSLDKPLASSLFDEGDAATYVTLTKDVVEEFYYPDTRRPAYRILFTKGQVVSKAQIEALNARIESNRAIADNGGVDPENPAGIDATTIASGTQVKADA